MMRKRKSLLASLAATLVIAISAAACAPANDSSGVVVRKAWTRPAPAGGVGGGFGEIVNTGRDAVTVVSLTTPRAERTEFHQTAEDGGIYSMKDFPNGIVIPAHGKLVLAPGGYHAMMIGMKTRTETGQTIPATLTLLSNGQTQMVDISFAVRNTAP
jgi:copper(I)-binding protein